MSRRVSSIRYMILAAMFAALTAVAGQIAIPLPPVPVTLQTLMVMLAGSVLGARWGAASMGLFILLAAFGVPVLSGGTGGLAVLVGPTAGYIWSWPLAAFFIGWWTEKMAPRLHFWKMVLVHFVWGVPLVYLFGVSWLVLAAGLEWNVALATGMLPFIPGDLVKVLIASSVAVSLNRAYPIIQPRT
ncbi:biotin transporter BioY [Desmospora profundinema]|uniref:Biotin transporter n=1 Tax=Desmospora profundinema TaxID=1571184 RepID=A0ABU1IU01_9BACL|nr:biotin transporter BioY [Desmospora profundinema]MDR6227399.1 biotin transport system substrate-specific component [Desmospora profundinema]